MKKSSIIKLLILIVASVGFWSLVLAFLFPSFPSQVEQITSLKEKAYQEAKSVMGANPFTLNELSESCWEYGSNKDKEWEDYNKGRNCSYGFVLQTGLPKSEITDLITANDWKKVVRNPGTKIEITEYTKEGAVCSISDNEILSASEPPQPDDSLVRVKDHYRFSCFSSVLDRSLKSFLEYFV